MKVNQIVKASSKVDATLPLWIRNPDVVIAGDGISSYSQENHRNFVTFMTSSGESQERVGFGQDLLQNLLKYRDFDFYSSNIIPYGYLAVDGITGQQDIVDRPILEQNENPVLGMVMGDAAQILAGWKVNKDLLMLDKDEVDMLELADGYGFPDENGVLLIDDEVILYRRKEGNKFYDLRRGSSAVVVLPSYREEGKYYSKTTPASHYAGSVVYNLSVLSLMAILDAIHNTYTHNITRDRVVPEVNRATILKHIKDFFRSKGTKLGIKALFKILFGENDVDVFYPGDRMITPSKSTWAEGMIMRTVPVPNTFCNPEEKYTTPDNTIGSQITLKSYSATITNEDGNQQTLFEEDEFAISAVDYAVSYQTESETQYELYLNEDYLQGRFITNPRTKLTRLLHRLGESNDNRRDVFTITVESTLGFPNKGLIFIDNEAILYQRKTPNQFLDCHRGYIGVETEHKLGAYVYGPYYVETRIVNENNEEFVSRSWPLGLVEDVDVKEPGLLHTIEDKVVANGPGRVDPMDPLLCTLNYDNISIENNSILDYTFLENYNDELTRQRSSNPVTFAYVGDRTHGPDGIFFDDDFAFVSSSGFPSYTIGNFITTDTPPDQYVSNYLTPDHFIAVIPRRSSIKENPYTSKGTDIIGVFIDGVRAYSQTSPFRIVQGRIARVDVLEPGEGYVNPTVVLTPSLSEATVTVSKNRGLIESVEVTTDGLYKSDALARISSGEGASVIPSFDRYGRIESLFIRDPGRYYNDIPSIRAIDETGKGKGALFSCEVSGGRIVKIDILNHGIDYDKTYTSISVIPVGSGAVIKPVVEYYEVNRYVEVVENPYWVFDDGNGFVYRPPLGEDRRYYGYVCSPTKLREEKGDDGTHHSPLLGFAFDGNPIYGPYGYNNNVDDENGIVRQLSAYILRPSRSEIRAGGGSLQAAFAPPSTADYPMGHFVQDYLYAPSAIKDILDPDRPLEGYLATEEPRYIVNNLSQYLEIELGEFESGQRLLTFDVDGNLYIGGSILITGSLIEGPHSVTGSVGNTIVTDQFGNVIIYGDVYVTGDSYTRAEIFLNEIGDDVLFNASGDIGIFGDLLARGAIVVNYDPDDDHGTVYGDPYLFNKILDRNNGKICNTPEYPKELYPDGIYCYFTTIDKEGKPAFPYIIGENFHNRPVSQRIDVVSQESVAPIPRQSIYSSQIIDDFELKFDFTRVERLRNPYLDSTNQEIELKIGEVSEGSIDKVHIQIPLPSKSAVGDYLFFDNSETTGAGAQAVISHIQGVEVTGSAGTIIESYVQSHHFLLLTPNNPTLVETEKVAIGDSINTVIRYNEYDQVVGRLIVETITKEIPKPTEILDDFLQVESNGDVVITGDLYINGFLDTDSTETITTVPGKTVEIIGNKDIFIEGNLYCNKNATTRSPITSRTPVGGVSVDQDGNVLITGELYVRGDIIIDANVSQDEIEELEGSSISYDLRREPFIISSVTPLPERKTQEILWLESVEHFKPGDKVKIETGYQYPILDTHENAVVTQIYNDGRIKIQRGEDARIIPNLTPIRLTEKYLYTVQCDVRHMLSVGDTVFMSGSDYEEINGEHKIIAVDDEQLEFSFYTKQLYEFDNPCLKYNTNSAAVIGLPTGVEVTSPGFGYASLPKVLGTYHRPIDRAETLIHKHGSGIGSVEVIQGGSRYVNPQAIFVDYEGFGSGAEAEVEVESGIVTSVIVTDQGSNYVDPILFIVETDGKFVCTTQNIGKIKSFRVLNPGRSISADRSLKPELMIDTRCVLKYDRSTIVFENTSDVIGVDDNNIEYGLQIVSDTITSDNKNLLEVVEGDPIVADEDGCGFSFTIDGGGADDQFDFILDGSDANAENDGFIAGDLLEEQYRTPRFAKGDLVYQGIPTNVTCVARVKHYDQDRQIVTLDTVVGNLRQNELLIGDGKIGHVLMEGQADCRVVVNGSAEPEGRFIDDTSKLSEAYAVIQDSYRYQWFSYVISSPIQQVDYETFVKEIIHPAGFIQFADLTIHSSVRSKTRTGQGDIVTILIDPCAPLKLLAADGTPILSSTENGDKYILSKVNICGDVTAPVNVLQLNNDTDNTLLSINDDGISTFTGILLRLNI